MTNVIFTTNEVVIKMSPYTTTTSSTTTFVMALKIFHWGDEECDMMVLERNNFIHLRTPYRHTSKRPTITIVSHNLHAKVSFTIKTTLR